MAGWWAAVRAALTPASAQWAVRPALDTVAAAAVVAIVGIITHHLASLGISYFGAACAAVLVGRGPYRQRAAALTIQAIGACAGFWCGALWSGVLGHIAVATFVGLASGLVGVFGRIAAGGGLMAVIGVAYEQFAGVDLSWAEQALWYFIGTAVIAVVVLAAWPFHRGEPEKQAVEQVWRASADLFTAAGADQATVARAALTGASTNLREAVHLGRRSTALTADVVEAQRAAFLAAGAYAERQPRPDLADWARSRADHRNVPDPSEGPPPGPPGPVWRPSRDWWVRSALANAARLGICVAVATAVTELLHSESHSYWIVLTVAVVVRPEYASVFVRSINRLVGTVIGGVVAAAALVFLGQGWPVAVVAALGLGFAVAAGPKLYALSVIGVTCSTLLSACIGAVDPAYPPLRVVDTLIGAAVAVLFGFLLWPGRAQPDRSFGVLAGLSAAAVYLDAVAESEPVFDARDRAYRAYRAAHRARGVTESALSEPPPVGPQALAILPLAVGVEELVDAITTSDMSHRDSTDGALDPERLRQLRQQLATLGDQSAAINS